MVKLDDKKIISVRLHAAANIGPKELNSITPGKDNVESVDFGIVDGECVGVYVISKDRLGAEVQDLVPMGDILRIRLENVKATAKAK